MKPVRRKSVQRERIYELIHGSGEHPSAQWIYDRLRNEFPTVSMGNVYRNIAILLEDGRIKAKEFGDGVVHYDAIIEPHYHFICELCNCIIDIPLPVQDELLQKAQNVSEHTINRHTIQFFGICKKCRYKRTK